MATEIDNIKLSQEEQDDAVKQVEAFLDTVRAKAKEGTLYSVIIGLACGDGSNIALRGSAITASFLIDQARERQLSHIGQARIAAEMQNRTLMGDPEGSA